MIDGVFEALPDALEVKFHTATGLNEAVIAQVQANVRKRILRAFVARGHIEACDAKDMAAYAHGGGFSVDAGVRIDAADRGGLERLLRYCARPPFAMDRLKQHRYYGVLAPNSPLRAAVTAMAQVASVVTPEVCGPVTEDAHTDAGTTVAVAGAGVAVQPGPPVKPKPRPPAHYLWAALIARIYEVFPLICPMCGGQMRIIAFIQRRHPQDSGAHRRGQRSTAHRPGARATAAGRLWCAGAGGRCGR